MDALERTLRTAAEVTRAKAVESLDLDAEWATSLRRSVDTSRSDRVSSDHRRRRLQFGLAAAAVVALVVGVTLVSWRHNGVTIRGVEPASDEPLATAGNTTIAPRTPTASQATTAPVAITTGATEPSSTFPASMGPPARVSYLDPPPEVTLRPLGMVTVPEPQAGSFSAAIGDVGVAVGSWLYGGTEGADRIDVIGIDGNTRRLDVASGLGAIIAYGPGDVVYTTRQAEAIADFSVVAVPLSGDRAGAVVASTLANINEYVEVPPSAFGHGEHGAIQRERNAGSTAIDYVGIDGGPTAPFVPPPPLFAESLELRTEDLGGRIVASTGVAWQLDIDAAPDRASPFIGPSPPAPGADGTGVYWTHIGPNLQPGTDFGEPSMWVIAQLDPDGSAAWWSIPDGWTVVASDMWGTVLAKQEGTELQLAMAEFGNG